MKNSDTPTRAAGVRGAVLGANPVQVLRLEPAPDLAAIVRNTWYVAWDVAPGEQRTQGVLPPPAVNVTVQPDEDAITGVQTRAGARVLRGEGWVCGILFRSAGFAALVGPELDRWIDRVEPVTPTLAPVDELRAAMTASDDPVARLQLLEDWLRPQVRLARPERMREAEEIVARVRDDRSIVRVDTLVAQVGSSERALHRLLRAWVGLGPKALIRRFRLLEAAHALDLDPDADLSALALSLGYADQAHFGRDFAATVGTPPGRYGRSLRDGRAASPPRRVR